MDRAQQQQQQQQQAGRDRPLVHNPNYPIQSHQSQYSSLGPPIQQPPFDPFQRRDPFMPAPSADRRDNPSGGSQQWPQHGSNATGRLPEPPQRDIVHPGHPPPPSSFHSRPSSMFSQEQNRSGSIGNTTPAGPPATQAPPQPLSFLNRHMPPPAASPQQSPGPAQPSPMSRGHLPAPPFGSQRDGHRPTSGHRPSNNMSISSIMESNLPQQQPNYSQITPRPTQAYTPSGSPHRNQLLGPGSTQSSSYGPHTPEARRYDTSPAAFTSAMTNTRSSGGHQTNQTGSPGERRQPMPHLSHGFQAAPSRPYSQPAGVYSNSQDRRDHSAYEPPPSNRSHEMPSNTSRRSVSDDYRQSNQHIERPSRERSISDMAGGKPFSAAPGSRPVQDSSFRNYTGQNQRIPSDNWQTFATDGGRDAPTPRSVIRSREGPPEDHAWNAGRSEFQHMRRTPGRSNTESQSRGERVRYASASPRPSFGPAYGVPAQSEARYGSMQTTMGPNYVERAYGPPEEQSDQLHDHYGRRTPMLDNQLRHSLEESQLPREHRALLGGIDPIRRMDRASPLPQAVQGASSQPAGSGRDPTIKSEFGRMFSGLGSGVGSTPQPMQPASNGSPTPNRQSIAVEDGEMHNGEQSRSFGPSSQTNRTNKRPYEDDAQQDSDSVGGRDTPNLNARGSKRSKLTNQSALPQQQQHHHHHHPHSHHHHHHHRKAASPEAMAPNRHKTTTPFSTIKFTNPTPPTQTTTTATKPPTAQATAGAPPHHHHHPTHHHHHHHHAPASTTRREPTPQTIQRPARVTVLWTPELRALAKGEPASTSTSTTDNLPHTNHRTGHLGSILYTTRITLPPRTTPLDTSFPYSSHPTPLPTRLFNPTHHGSTITIRIPRGHLTPSAREHATLQRQVWGTGIYTDDSDILAACIHAGFLRGKWPATVDEKVLEGLVAEAQADHSAGPEKWWANCASSSSSLTDNNANATAPTTIKSLPPDPPQNRDLHVTVRIMPALQHYYATVRFGLRSRAWGGNHDGVSFRVEEVRWVDDSLDATAEGVAGVEEGIGGEVRAGVASQRKVKRRAVGRVGRLESCGKGLGLGLGLGFGLGGKGARGRVVRAGA